MCNHPLLTHTLHAHTCMYMWTHFTCKPHTHIHLIHLCTPCIYPPYTCTHPLGVNSIHTLHACTQRYMCISCIHTSHMCVSTRCVCALCAHTTHMHTSTAWMHPMYKHNTYAYTSTVCVCPHCTHTTYVCTSTHVHSLHTHCVHAHVHCTHTLFTHCAHISLYMHAH